MTQLTITLDLMDDTKTSEVKKLLGKLDGVMNISISKSKKKIKKKTDKEMEKWIENVKWLSNNFDSSSLDMSDERTRYLMSK